MPDDFEPLVEEGDEFSLKKKKGGSADDEDTTLPLDDDAELDPFADPEDDNLLGAGGYFGSEEEV